MQYRPRLSSPAPIAAFSDNKALPPIWDMSNFLRNIVLAMDEAIFGIGESLLNVVAAMSKFENVPAPLPSRCPPPRH
jgi:hypothetical protein